MGVLSKQTFFNEEDSWGDCRQNFKWPSNLYAKMAMPDLQRYPRNLNPIKNAKDFSVFKIKKNRVLIHA